MSGRTEDPIRHVLTINRIPADGEYEEEIEWEITHTDECPQKYVHCGGPNFCLTLSGHDTHWYTHYECGVEYEIDNVGLDGLECSDYIDRSAYDAADPIDRLWEWKFLPKGRYEVIFWSEKYGGYPYEYDSGLSITQRLPDVLQSEELTKEA
jgi:hypothetical protein